MIEIKNLSAGYSKSLVIKNINMIIDKGTVVSVIGPNGSGKSTLLKCLAKQEVNVSGGDILTNGRSIYDIPPKEYAKKTAYLKQSAEIPVIDALSFTLHGRYPYLGFYRKYSETDKEIAKAAMIKTGVWQLRYKMLSELSGGELQKVYLAMALTRDADILLLDEPTTFLDIRYQLELMSLIRELKDEGKTTVAVLHNISDALKISDMICLVARGEVVFYGSPEEIIENLNLIEEVFAVTAETTVIHGNNHLFFGL